MWRETYKRDGGKARRDEVDQEGVAPLRVGCDEQGGEEEDEAPLAGEGEGTHAMCGRKEGMRGVVCDEEK